MSLLPKMVTSRGAVSPTTRATPNRTAVTIPDRAAGSTTDHTVLHRGTEGLGRLADVPVDDLQHLLGAASDGRQEQYGEGQSSGKPEKP